MSAAAGSSKSAFAAEMKKQERMNKLKELQMKRNQARKLNHQEVVEEDQRNKLPANWDQKRRRLEWESDEAKLKAECKEQGKDFDRVRLREVGADDAEKWEKKKKKKNPDQGFSDYEAATFRQYQGLTKQIKPDKDEYTREKEKLGEAFYPGVDTMGVAKGGHKDSEEAIDKLVTDIDKQQAKRAKFSRRRAHDEDDDIDYINERNMKFNKKLERFYGSHTAEIKQNLERGTAV
ncbi:unnamed protein product [Owenia fusiformis]|uniref:Pre-mRNA-splicing factor SYF2 n=1 Tax=Owenia fusiformis TaxID=6347 RepID=A0A8J1UKY6_OWEFU|nr:unnamed protein product [Owenia fusiformis]